MSASDAPRALPPRPSEERLRKLAKRLAASEGVRLSEAQRRLAHDHGFRNWTELLAGVRAGSGRSPLSAAALKGDLAAVEALLAAGAPVDGSPGEDDTPLFLTCGSTAPIPHRLAVATRLIEAGAFVRAICTGGRTPLHAAARTGPAELVELLLRHGALVWQGDWSDRRPVDDARDGAPADRDRVLELCADGPMIAYPLFRAAVVAIQTGDEAELAALLDRDPTLLTRRAVEPDVGPRGYFSDPKLFWFVANNPTLIPASPPNIIAVARLMMARGVEQEDLDYALGLVATNGMMDRALQIALAKALIDGGANPGGTLTGVLGHRQVEIVEWLVARGRPLDAPVAAGLGRIDALPALLAAASRDAVDEALALATINGQAGAVRLCLAAGADPNRFMPVHAHSTPLHQAALNGDLEIMRMLVEAGARPDVPDTLWRGTPLGWAMHGGQTAAADYLRGLDG